MWKKGEPDKDGYFTLRNCQSPKVMTAIAEDRIEINGK